MQSGDTFFGEIIFFSGKVNLFPFFVFGEIICFVFIGPRYTWGPIYGSECLKLTEGGL